MSIAPDPVAVYAATISTVLGLWTVYERLWSRVKVTGSYGRMADPSSGPLSGMLLQGDRFDTEAMGQGVVVVRVVNVGSRPVTVCQLGFAAKHECVEKRHVFTGNMNELPRDLTTGQWFSCWARASELELKGAGDELLYPYAKDIEDKLHKGKFDPHVDAWLGAS